MAGRTKRNLSKGVGDIAVSSTNPASSATPETAPLPSGEPGAVVVGVLTETAAEPATSKPPRKSRSRKQPGVEPAAAIVEPAGLAPPPLPPLLVEAGEALRLVKDRSTEVQEQLRSMKEEMQGVVREAAEVRQASLALKQELLAAGDAVAQLHQVRMVREELQETMREAAEVKEKTLVVKQEVMATENALAELRQTLQTTHRLREEVQSAGKEVEAVRERSLAVTQELQTTETSLQAIRQTVDALRDDLKGQFREAGSRFLTISEACKDLEKEVRQLQTRIESLRETPAPVVTVAVSGAPAVVSAPVEESGTAGTFVASAAAEPPAAEPVGPSGEEVHSEGKKQLGITVNPQAMVVEVLPETPAERAGLHTGDVVLGVDGKSVANSDDLRTAIEQSANEDVQLTVARGEEKEELTAHLAEAPAS